MMKIPRRHRLGLVAGVLFSTMAVAGPAPSSAQGVQVTMPTNPTWARWLGLETGGELFLNRAHQKVQIGNFAEPRRVRVCLTSSNTNVAARVITEAGETVVPVGRCREIEAARITVTPARDMGSKERVKGLYNVVG